MSASVARVHAKSTHDTIEGKCNEATVRYGHHESSYFLFGQIRSMPSSVCIPNVSRIMSSRLFSICHDNQGDRTQIYRKYELLTLTGERTWDVHSTESFLDAVVPDFYIVVDFLSATLGLIEPKLTDLHRVVRVSLFWAYPSVGKA